MLPTVLLGSVTGVYINILLPELVLMIVMSMFLIFVTYLTLSKGISIFKKETRVNHAGSMMRK